MVDSYSLFDSIINAHTPVEVFHRIEMRLSTDSFYFHLIGIYIGLVISK